MSSTATPTAEPAGTPTAEPAAAEDAARIGALRQEIDDCDAEIIRLVQRRLAVSQQIGALRRAAGGTRLSLSREQQVLARFTTELGPDGTALGMVLLRRGRGPL